MDAKVIPLVNFFNSVGLKTIMSCEGHNKTNMSLFWIEFSPEIQEKDIIEFMSKHKTAFKNSSYFISNGRFAQRVLLTPNEAIRRSWLYIAASPIAADDDLKRWQSFI